MADPANPVGRPRKEIDGPKVKALAGLGLTIPEIADWFHVSHDTVERNYHDELEEGWAEMKMSIKRAQYNLGVNKQDRVMLIWLGKQHLGQRDDPSGKGQSGKNEELDSFIDALRQGPVEAQAGKENPATAGEENPEAKPEAEPQLPDGQEDL